MMGVCYCSLAGTAACQTCWNNPASAHSPVKVVYVQRVEDLARRVDDYFTPPKTKTSIWEFAFTAADGTPRFSCSKCKGISYTPSRFCPNCGSRMEREK